MLRKIFFFIAFFSATHVVAQGSATPVKNTEKPADTQIDYTLMGAPMPPLRYLVYRDTGTENSVNTRVSKTFLTNKDFKNSANLFVMMFNPTCTHCQEETVRMGRSDSLFKKSKVVLIGDPRQAHFIKAFIKSTRFEEYPFYLGIDSSDFIRKVFLYKALPQINIYDKHRKLIKTFNGDVAIDSLRQYIQ